MKIKLICASEKIFEDKVNNFLTENKDKIKVKEIKWKWMYYHYAMIIYEEV
ncbi:hypothetical protein PV797_05125 [Clostridiaceae bacterium M8S5]|nr:hypothetical protein PV797_05125 [Clostridiaceae bacterium M8S5]